MKKIKYFSAIICLSSVLLFASCSKDFNNPNAASDTQVLSSAKGLMGVTVGLQRTYALTVHPSMISAVGLVTGETFVINAGFTSEANLGSGGAAVDGDNRLLINIWTSNCKVIYDANAVLSSATSISDPGYKSGSIAYASIFKALALGNLSMLWDNIPDTVGAPVNNPTKFITRTAGYSKAISTIDAAIAQINATPIASSFLSDAPIGLDIVNTLNALRARYALYAGNLSLALASANAVDLNRSSVMNFEALNPNPVFINITSSNNIYQPIDSTFSLPIGLRPAVNDSRVLFYTSVASSGSPRFRLNGFWNSSTRAIPIYLPDEIKLIQAECLLRQLTPNINGAKSIIDEILQQIPAQDRLGVGANIAAGYTGLIDVGSLLLEVYRNRCIELFHSGNRLEDMRRFGRPNSEMKRRNMPYPFRERDNNPNTPVDPIF